MRLCVVAASVYDSGSRLSICRKLTCRIVELRPVRPLWRHNSSRKPMRKGLQQGFSPTLSSASDVCERCLQLPFGGFPEFLQLALLVLDPQASRRQLRSRSAYKQVPAIFRGDLTKVFRLGLGTLAGTS